MAIDRIQDIAPLILLGSLLAPAGAGAQSSAPIELRVRVFNGLEEITTHCRLAVYTADTREAPFIAALQDGTGHHVEVDPGLYDLHITWRVPDGTVAIEWATHLSVLRYPDEGGRHVEIVNLQTAFGALLVRPPSTWLESDTEWSVRAFLPGGVGRAGFEPTDGSDHRLFILPAGSYDLVGRSGSTELSVTDVEVPAQRTRLKLLEIR